MIFQLCVTVIIGYEFVINPLTPNDPYRSRTAPLNSKRCILCNYSTNIGTEYFKHGINSPFFKCSLFHNSNIFGSCIIHILYTGCAKIKINNSSTKKVNIPLTKKLFRWFSCTISRSTLSHHCYRFCISRCTSCINFSMHILYKFFDAHPV